MAAGNACVCRGNKRGIVMDGSDEIAGGGLTANPCIGNARRMHLTHDTNQADVALEAVQNHNPQVNNWSDTSGHGWTGWFKACCHARLCVLILVTSIEDTPQGCKHVLQNGLHINRTRSCSCWLS